MAIESRTRHSSEGTPFGRILVADRTREPLAPMVSGERVRLAAHEPVIDEIKREADHLIQTEYRRNPWKILFLKAVRSTLHGLRTFLLTTFAGAGIVTLATLASILGLDALAMAFPSLGTLSILKIILPIGASIAGIGIAGMALGTVALFALGWVGKRVIYYLVNSGMFSTNELEKGLVKHNKSKPIKR